MAITATALNVGGQSWAVSATSADASGTEEILAAAGTGTAHYLTQLTIGCVSAITVTVGAGETGGAVTTIAVGPIPFAATSGSPVTVRFAQPVKLTDETSVTVGASGAGAIWVLAEGFTR